jgi:Putative zinc-finger
MNGCWSEGELRAWVDGELPARDMERVGAHIEVCGTCHALWEEVSTRGTRVGTWLEALPEMAAPVKLPAIPRRAQSMKPLGIGGGIAAALLVTLLLSHTSAPHPQPVPAQAVLKLAPPRAVSVASAPRVKRAIRRRLRPKNKPRIEDFIALDNEPLETGIVVRVSLDTGPDGVAIPADVIVGPDGRPRAIRLITDIAGEQ